MVRLSTKKRPLFPEFFHHDSQFGLILHEPGAHVVVYSRDIRNSCKILCDLFPDGLIVHACKERSITRIMLWVGNGFHRQMEKNLLSRCVEAFGCLGGMGSEGQNGKGNRRLEFR